MRVRERGTQSITLLDSQMLTGHSPLKTTQAPRLGHALSVIRSLDVKQDGFLQEYRTRVSQSGTKSKSFKHLKLNIIRTYRISLTKAEQEALENSTLAKVIRQKRAEKTCTPENLFTKGPLKFLPNYRSPCWYPTDQQLHCLPFFHLIGAPKSGTTDVYKILRLHPDYMPNRKEYHWLTRARFCSQRPYMIYSGDGNVRILRQSCTSGYKGYTNTSTFDWYTGMMGKPLADNRSHAQHAVTGDLSASTLWQNSFWPKIEDNSLPLEPTFTNADFIYHLNNKTKIIAILRNPIDRLYSGYKHFNKTRRNDPKQFHQDVVKSIDYFTNCFEMYSVRSCVHAGGNQAMTLVYVGLYYIHLLEWYRVFPRDQVLILRLEDYTRHRTQSALQIYDFLELRKLSKEEASHIKAATSASVHANANKQQSYKETMLEETRYLLYTFYKPFNQALAQLLGDPSFDYGLY